MFGRFENFPNTYHGAVQLLYQFSSQKLQLAILEALHNLILEEKPAFPSVPAVSGCKVNFDFGIAEGATFSYLDEEILNDSLKIVSQGALPVLDFFCVVRYYRRSGRGVYRPLKFDYYLLRFLFYEGGVDLQVLHERGTRRLSIEDLHIIVVNRVGRVLSERGLPEIAVRDISDASTSQSLEYQV